MFESVAAQYRQSSCIVNPSKTSVPDASVPNTYRRGIEMERSLFIRLVRQLLFLD